MTQSEKIELVAVYDGWRKQTTFRSTPWYLKDGVDEGGNIEHFNKYLTSLDWLHPVAMRVKKQLEDIMNNQREMCTRDTYFYIEQIDGSCAENQKDGQYIDLFEAVVLAILFINDQKQKQNA
jgi:hypothetical protein